MRGEWRIIESKNEGGDINNFKGVCKNYRGTLFYKLKIILPHKSHRLSN